MWFIYVNLIRMVNWFYQKSMILQPFDPSCVCTTCSFTYTVLLGTTLCHCCRYSAQLDSASQMLFSTSINVRLVLLLHIPCCHLSLAALTRCVLCLEFRCRGGSSDLAHIPIAYCMFLRASAFLSYTQRYARLRPLGDSFFQRL